MYCRVSVISTDEEGFLQQASLGHANAIDLKTQSIKVEGAAWVKYTELKERGNAPTGNLRIRRLCGNSRRGLVFIGGSDDKMFRH